ncbi:MAG: sulfite exporter TauE/SafE family protein [Acidimicrobiia bacterium]
MPPSLAASLPAAASIQGLTGFSFVVVLAAGYVQGFTGFGFAVVFTPLAVFFVSDTQQVVLLSLFLGAVLSVGVLVESRRGLRAGRIRMLLGGAVVGTPAGVAVLSVVSPHVLRVIITVSALLVATLWLIRLPPPLKRENGAVWGGGLIGGFLNGSTSMGGPPPALLASIQRWPVEESRAALTTFNLVSYVLGLATAAVSGLLDTDFLLGGLRLLPIAIAGSLLGGWSARRVSKAVFRYALLGTVWMAGLFGLVSVLRG